MCICVRVCCIIIFVSFFILAFRYVRKTQDSGRTRRMPFLAFGFVSVVPDSEKEGVFGGVDSNASVL